MPRVPPPMDESQSIAGLIRHLLERGDATAREQLASWSLSYVSARLRGRHSRWRFGFQGSFAEVALEVADLEVAELLCEDTVNPATRFPLLARRLANVVFRDSADDEAKAAWRKNSDAVTTPLVTWLLQRTDPELFLSYRLVLRTRAEQGAYLRWRREHPEEARMERNLRMAIKRSRHLRLHKDRRGRFLCSASSDLHRAKIEAETLQATLQGMRRFSAPSILEQVEHLLAAGREHGGYCHLLDLARAACAVRFDLLARAIDQELSRDPRSYSDWRDALPVEMRMERLRWNLERLAHRILDRRKGGVQSSVREIWIGVALEMVLRRYEIFDPRWQGQSQRAILEEMLSGETGSMSLAQHNNAVTYLVRRLRRAWGD